jgi:molecular chaperone DnaJ
MVYIPEQLDDRIRSAVESIKDDPNLKPSESTKQRLFSKLKHIFE